MTLRALCGTFVAAALLLLATPALEAGEGGLARTKLGASGQVYTWQAGTC